MSIARDRCDGAFSANEGYHIAFGGTVSVARATSRWAARRGAGPASRRSGTTPARATRPRTPGTLPTPSQPVAKSRSGSSRPPTQFTTTASASILHAWHMTRRARTMPTAPGTANRAHRHEIFLCTSSTPPAPHLDSRRHRRCHGGEPVGQGREEPHVPASRAKLQYYLVVHATAEPTTIN